MMKGFERYTKKTRRAMFLEEMEQVVPWAKLCALIENALSEARQRTAAERAGADAADLFSPALVQSGGPGGGRGFVRLVDPAAVRGN